uniref:NADH-ubiquinone oxidoreductase chain 3 n=1 Tax=Chrysoporthe austroafricana TaxID=354353 RepID=A0A191MWN5_9PEZI|nr:NADH dehydrogenase subunit 3 [Chrysoporthe austroafricana]AMX22080.1 NADH dehydrogenase subunit 3 [Chrysoporthe austroafricana]
MSSMTLFILFVNIIAVLFLVLNLLFAPHNPYAEKFSSFECGFHSFLGQNRSQFNIKFFIFGLLFLLFDLEITLIFPFAVSQSTNGLYGLIIVLIFMILITLGFIFELGKGALKMDSKQNLSDLSRKSTNSTISYLGEGKTNLSCQGGLYQLGTAHPNNPRLFSTCMSSTLNRLGMRRYSSLYSKRKDFFKKIELSARLDSKLSDKNPFTIVSSFLKKYPYIETAKNYITFELLNSIQGDPKRGNFNTTEAEFDILRNIKPKRFNFPLNEEALKDLKLTLGDKNRGSIKAGVYIFTNKLNGYCYVGSSTQIAVRLLNNYLGNNRKNRKIDIILKELKLDNFYLDVYILPDSMLEYKDTSKLKCLVLFLEQYYILYLNPEYNSLKVAGSTLGPEAETLLKMRLNNPRRIKVSFTDISTNVETVYDSIIAAGKALGKSPSQISEYIRAERNKPFLNKYIIKKIAVELPLKVKSLDKPGTGVEVLDLTSNEKTNYSSMRKAALDLNISPASVQNYLFNGKVYQDRYVFSKNIVEDVEVIKETKQITRNSIEVTDIQNSNSVTIYSSMLEASRALDCSNGAIPKYLNKCSTNRKPFKGRYIINKL